jgi:hypothetical protein
LGDEEPSWAGWRHRLAGCSAPGESRVAICVASRVRDSAASRMPGIRRDTLEKPERGSQVESGMSQQIPPGVFPLPDEPEEPAPGAWRSDWMVEVSADRGRRWEMPDGTWEREMPKGKWRCAVSSIRAEFHSVKQEREESARDADETCTDPEKRRARRRCHGRAMQRCAHHKRAIGRRWTWRSLLGNLANARVFGTRVEVIGAIARCVA